MVESRVRTLNFRNEMNKFYSMVQKLFGCLWIASPFIAVQGVIQSWPLADPLLNVVTCNLG